MTFTHEKEENVVRISSEKPIETYAWPVLSRLQPNPYNNFEYVKLRFAKNLIPKIYQFCLFLGNIGIRNKGLTKIDPIKIDRNKTIDCYEIKLCKIGAILMSEEENNDYAEELKHEFEKA